MELIFIRHGEPAWGTQPDPGLTDRGHRQSELTATLFSEDHMRLNEIFVSPRRRARETAAPIEAVTGVRATVVQDLTEVRLPDGETFESFPDRISTIMLALLDETGVRPHGAGGGVWDSESSDHRIAIVAHRGTNAFALSFLLGIEPTQWEWERFYLGHSSMARLKLVPQDSGHIFSLRVFNDRNHLPYEMRTR